MLTRRGHRMITAGIDCGARSTKTVVMKDGIVIGRSAVLTGFDLREAVRSSLEKALAEAGIAREELAHIAATGSGKDAVTEADVKVNDVTAGAAGARYCFPDAGTVVDVGAEEARAAKMSSAGLVEDFAVNDRCAAGAGAFIEAMARALETPLSEIGSSALTSTESIPMNAQCVVFAESEVVGLIHAKTPKNDISRAIHDAMASRIVSLIRRVGLTPDVVMIGGVARNPGIAAALKRDLGVEAIYIPEHPEHGAAVGAAVTAARHAARRESGSEEDAQIV